MENNWKLNITKPTSVPQISKVNQDCSSVNRTSVTHPSVCSRSRDYLESIFKKINSGENVLSRLPTRLDPNIEFSDDDDDEEDDDNPPAKTSPDRVKYVKKEEIESNKAIAAAVMKTPLAPASRYQFKDIYSEDSKFRATGLKQEKMYSKFSSASKINTSKASYVEHRKIASVSSNPLDSFSSSNLKSQLQQVSNSRPSLNPNKSNIDDISENEGNKIFPSLPSDIIQVNNKNYMVLSLLGSGGSCKVFSVIDGINKSLLAIKRVNLKDTDPTIRDGYMQEIQYLQKLQNSDRVIKMYDFQYLENELLLVLEHGDIDFARYISKESKLKRLTPLMIKFFWVQMLEAVGDIHKYGIVHSDLKPANFLLVAGNLKLIDFGIATAVPDDKTSIFRDTQVGTLNFMSPEAITQMSGDNKHPLFKVGVKSDVWSLGCILYNLVYGVTPFYNIKLLMQKIYAITNPNYEIPFNPLSDPLLLDVLKSCLKRNPKERASVEELLQHPYLSKETSSTNPVPLKSNTDFENVLVQMQNLTPRRMRHITEVVQQLSKREAP